MAVTDAQMQAMQDAKDIDTGVDTRSKEDMLAQQMDAFKTIGKVGGELAVESIPGVSEEISMQNIQDALARGDKAGAGIEAGAMALGVVPLVGDAAAKLVRASTKKYRQGAKLRVDNPGYDEFYEKTYADLKQEYADEAKQKALSQGQKDTYAANIGSSDGITGSANDVKFSPKELKTIPGSMGEEKFRSTGQKLVNLKRNIAEEGYKPDNILIHVREDGQPFIVEGNHRLAEALDSGRETITADIKYLRGAEEKEGLLDPRNIFPNHSFAEGGAVPMKEQMSMFEDGGLMDEGGSIDPVSGNDVPPGSTQEEVRDDIPAQLSEGEFVFPADVVRFIGLGNLMQIRQEAKMGLKQMDAMGQMGNSDEATMPDDLPFDLNDLDMEDDGEYNDTQEFAVGGMPTPNTNTGVYYTPAAAQGTTGVTAPQPVQAASSQYVAPQQQAVPTTATTATPTYESFIKPVEGSAPEIREYINTKTGEKMSITFVNNQPTVAIPPDFVPASEYVAPETVASQTSRVKSTKQVDEPAGREEIEKEEAMFGPGGGRISLGGNVDKGRVSGATQFGVSFSNMGGLPGVGGTAMTALGLATGKGIPEDARATITRDGVSVTISGTDYNKMKSEKFRGKTSDSIMDKWQQEKNEVNKQKDLREYKRQALEELAAKSAEEIKAEKAEQDRQMRAAFSKFADPSGDGAGGSMDTSFDTSGGEGGGESVGSPSGPTGSQSEVDDFESDLG